MLLSQIKHHINAMLLREAKGQSMLTMMRSIKGAEPSILWRRVNSIFTAGNLFHSCPV